MILTQTQIEEIVALMKREIVPALGCTEPIAVALCVARAKELLGEVPTSITVNLSPNVVKNAMGVGIPNTGMVGLGIAIALGALCGESKNCLEVLRDVTKEDVARGQEYLESHDITIATKSDECDKLYIEVEVAASGRSAKAIIAKAHSNFVYLERDGEVILDESLSTPTADNAQSGCSLTLRTVWEFAQQASIEQLEFILESRDMNLAAAEQSLLSTYGHGVGQLLRSDRSRALMGDTLYSQILSMTSAACDARMAGAMIPVMSNSGSGNQGVTATLPVVVYADGVGASREALIRALVLSHLTVIYIKQNLGKLSALCGCVVAASGTSCGIAYLMGGNYENMVYAVKNMIANLTGMICDGAKPSCSMKLSSGVSTALLSAMMAMEGRFVSCAEGIIEEDVDLCIQNLTRISNEAMVLTDQMVLNMMTNKSV